MDLDFDEAINTHLGWKGKLKTYLQHADGSIDAAKVRRDDACKLGQWLRGEGRQYATMPEYKLLMQEHARFHKAAAAIVQLADAGQNTAGATALGSTSEFGEASLNVITAIRKLKGHVQRGV